MSEIIAIVATLIDSSSYDPMDNMIDVSVDMSALTAGVPIRTIEVAKEIKRLSPFVFPYCHSIVVVFEDADGATKEVYKGNTTNVVSNITSSFDEIW